MKNIHVDIGNIDLIIDILRNNMELCLEIPERSLNYFIDMIRDHGKESKFLQIYDILVTH